MEVERMFSLRSRKVNTFYKLTFQAEVNGAKEVLTKDGEARIKFRRCLNRYPVHSKWKIRDLETSSSAFFPRKDQPSLQHSRPVFVSLF